MIDSLCPSTTVPANHPWNFQQCCDTEFHFSPTKMKSTVWLTRCHRMPQDATASGGKNPWKSHTLRPIVSRSKCRGDSLHVSRHPRPVVSWNVESLKELAFCAQNCQESCWNCPERQRWIKWDPCQDMTCSKQTPNTIETRVVSKNVISQTTPASHSKELPQDAVLWCSYEYLWEP